jgi:hypothetical protein
MNQGSTSKPQTVTLSNTGNTSLSIAGIVINSGAWDEFNETNNCGSSVLAGANCTFSVTFSPFTNGSLQSAINIFDNAANSPQAISLSGTGLPSPIPAGTYSIDVQGNGVGPMRDVQLTVNVQ